MRLLLSRCIAISIISFGGLSLSIAETQDTVTQSSQSSSMLASDQTEAQVTINDPVATYDGIPISKKDFLDFVKYNLGSSIEKYPDEKILKQLVESYVAFDYLAREAESMQLLEIPKNKNNLKVIEDVLLASELENMDPHIDEQLSIETFPISSEELLFFNEYIQKSIPKELINDTETRKELESMYNKIKTIANIAKKVGVVENDTFQLSYQQETKKYLAQLAMDKYLDSHIKKDSEVELIYQNWKKEQKPFYYKVSHIYLDDYNTAQQVLEKLHQNKLSFIEAVDLYSLDSFSKSNSGKVAKGEWVNFSLNNPLLEELEKMSINQLSDVVKGPTGKYHILYLNDKKKDTTDLDLNDSNELFKTYLWKKKIVDDYYQGLFKRLKIELNQ